MHHVKVAPDSHGSRPSKWSAAVVSAKVQRQFRVNGLMHAMHARKASGVALGHRGISLLDYLTSRQRVTIAGATHEAVILPTKSRPPVHDSIRVVVKQRT